MYTDRLDAGMQLAEALIGYKDQDGIVLAIPRGGVPVGYVVARELQFPLEVILAKKIGHPFNKEYAIGAVSPDDRFVDRHPDVSQEYIDSETEIVRARLEEMARKFCGERKPATLKNKLVIVVDDGIATGNTLLATLRMLKKQSPQKLIVAVPVSPPAALEKLKPVADEVVSLITTNDFGGVGAFYEDFSQVSDEEVKHYLDKRESERKR